MAISRQDQAAAALSRGGAGGEADAADRRCPSSFIRVPPPGRRSSPPLQELYASGPAHMPRRKPLIASAAAAAPTAALTARAVAASASAGSPSATARAARIP